MNKLMCWSEGSLKVLTDKGWVSYRQLPAYMKKPDLPIQNASKGYPTYQHLRDLGYTIVNASEMSKVSQWKS